MFGCFNSGLYELLYKKGRGEESLSHLGKEGHRVPFHPLNPSVPRFRIYWSSKGLQETSEEK